MKKNIIMILLIMNVIIPRLSAQDWKFKILEVDTSSYPKIKTDFIIFEAKAKVIKSIDKGDIKIYEGKRRIQNFDFRYLDSNSELRLAILLDVSGSMRGSKFKDAKKAIRELLSVIDKKNKVALFTFGSKIIAISNFTSDFAYLSNAVDKINKLSPKTRLYDGLLEVTNLFSSIENTRNGIILITDGKDDGSYSELSESIRNANKNGVEVFSIGIGKNADLQTLGKISYQTGAGYSGIIEPGELRFVLKNIHELLTKNYQISFNTPDSIVEVAATSRKLGLSISYKGFEKKEVFEFVVPKYNPYTNMNWIYILVIGFILFAIILLIVTIINTRSKSEDIVLGSESYFDKTSSEYDTGEIYPVESFDGDDEKTNFENWEDEFRQNIQDQKTVIISGGKFQTFESLGYLVMRSEKFGMHVYEIQQKELIIGRGAEADILLEDEEVSKFHTKVRVIENDFFVDDMGSSNGTFVNGKKEYHKKLEDGDVISICSHEFVFKCIS